MIFKSRVLTKYSIALGLPSYLTAIKPSGEAPANIHYVDLKLGNKCNLACSTCNPDDSSFWIKDWTKLKIVI